MLSERLYDKLLQVVSRFGVDINHDCEGFLERERLAFSGSDDEFVQFVDRKSRDWFRCVSGYPEWMQNAEWQFYEGRPMTYVGCLEVPAKCGLFHDDSAVFVFITPSGVVKEVFQVV